MTTYTIEHRGNCVLIRGAVPLSAFEALTKLAPKGSLLDQTVARIYGATFAFGLAADLQALRAAGAPAAEAREQAKHPQAPARLVQWLASGERGTSSNTIVQMLTGIQALGDSKPSHPHDADDFSRCRLLLEQVPELLPDFPRIAEASRAWAGLVREWSVICAAMDAEAPKWREGSGTCRRTTGLIRAATGEA